MLKVSKMDMKQLEEELIYGPEKDVIEEIDVSIRGKNKIIQIITQDEERVIYRLRQISKSMFRKNVFWTCASGPFIYNNKDDRETYNLMVNGENWGDNRIETDPMTFLDYINEDDDLSPPQTVNKNGKDIKYGGGANYIMLDLPNFMPSSNGSNMSSQEILIARKLKDLNYFLHEKNEKKNLIIVSRDIFISEDLKKIVPIIDWPIPNKKIILDHLKYLYKEIENIYSYFDINTKFSDDDLSKLADSLLGLTLDEITGVFRKTAVRSNSMDLQNFIKFNIKSKKDIIRKSRSGLEFYESDVNITDGVGGLNLLKKWLEKRVNTYSDEALEYGLEYPKGLLIVGIPGNGKSLIAKAIAKEWNKLLLKWDVASVYSSRVGGSEANIRNAIQTAEAVAPCVLFIDEIEKAFSGISSSDRSDGGTSARVFGTFIQWLSEKKSPVFVVATANRIDQLPAELIRKGRFDEIFYVDLPKRSEREEIFKIHFNKRNIDFNNFNMDKILDASENFTGAEIESIIKESMYSAYSDNKRKVNEEDIIEEIEAIIPIALTMEEQINSLRQWAYTRAKWASDTNIAKKTIKNQLKESGSDSIIEWPKGE